MPSHVPGRPCQQDVVIHGFFHLDDPRDFFPDDECSSPEEIAAHREACERADRGEPWEGPTEEHGPWTHADGRVVIGDRPEGDGWVGQCHARRSFGLGTFIWHVEADHA